MNVEIEIECHTCPHKWTMTYSQLKREAERTVHRNDSPVEARGETTVETYVVKCPKDGTRIAVDIELNKKEGT